MANLSWRFHQIRRWPSGHKTAKTKPLFRCTECTQRTTKSQATGSGGYCIYCKAPLRAFNEFGVVRFGHAISEVVAAYQERLVKTTEHVVSVHKKGEDHPDTLAALEAKMEAICTHNTLELQYQADQV